MPRRNPNEEQQLKRGLHVEVRNNDVNRAMRKLKKMCNNEGLFKDMRDKEFYEKPSLKKKKEKAAARKRWLKQVEKNKEKYGY
jgi:small subunit ribosomal protein S21